MRRGGGLERVLTESHTQSPAERRIDLLGLFCNHHHTGGRSALAHTTDSVYAGEICTTHKGKRNQMYTNIHTNTHTLTVMVRCNLICKFGKLAAITAPVTFVNTW